MRGYDDECVCVCAFLTTNVSRYDGQDTAHTTHTPPPAHTPAHEREQRETQVSSEHSGCWTQNTHSSTASQSIITSTTPHRAHTNPIQGVRQDRCVSYTLERVRARGTSSTVSLWVPAHVCTHRKPLTACDGRALTAKSDCLTPPQRRREPYSRPHRTSRQ